MNYFEQMAVKADRNAFAAILGFIDVVTVSMALCNARVVYWSGISSFLSTGYW